jgi:hypothetical protein
MRIRWCTLILGYRNLGFAFSERECEPYGAHSFWEGETYVVHSQNEIRTPWCTLILGWRNLRRACPEREANPMVHAHCGLAIPKFAFPERDTVWRTFILGWPYLSCALPGRDANHMVHTHSRLPKPRFRIPRTRCELVAARSFQVCEA